MIDEYQGGLNAFLDPSKRVKGIGTGFTKLDEKTSGLHAGDLFILAARPSMGKTALALNIAQHVATKAKRTVAVFSLEMSKESLLTRMLCATARVDSQKFRAGYLSADERKRLQAAASSLVEAPLFIDDTAGIHLMDIHAKLRRPKAEHGLGLVIVDYLQLMSGRGRFENRNQEISTHLARHEAAGQGSERADDRAVAAQPRARNAAGRSPPAAQRSARERIDRAGRRPGGVHLPRRGLPARTTRACAGQAELILAKQRNGPVGKVELVFLHEFTKFENRAADLGDSPDD